MAATFPGGVKTFSTKNAGDQIGSAHINDLQAEVVAVETELRKTTGSVVDHGGLAGLSDNDHPQYLLATGKAADSDKLDGKDSTEFLLTTGKAADSDKLDNIDSSGFVQTSGNQTIAGIKTFSSFPITPSSDPTTNYQVSNKKYVDDSVSPLGVWASYTVSWTADTTNPSIGDGSLIGRYTQIGKTVVCNLTLTIGSTTNCGSGNWKIGLPKTSKNSNMTYSGIWVALDSGVNFYDGIAVLYPNINFINTFIRTGSFSSLSASSPHSWGQGDQLYIAITYEAE